MFESILLYLSFLFKFPFVNDLVGMFVLVFVSFAVSLAFVMMLIKGVIYLIFLKSNLRKAKNAIANRKVQKSKKGKAAEVERINSSFWKGVFVKAKFISYWSAFFMVLIFISLTGLYFLEATTKIKPFYGFESLIAEAFYFGFLFLINFILLILMIRYSYLESKAKKSTGTKKIKSVLLTMLVVVVMFFILLFILV